MSGIDAGRKMSAETEKWRRFASEFDFMARLTGDARYDRLLQLLPPHTRRALDAGCGTGLLAARLATRVPHVVALDISAAMMAFAKRNQAQQALDHVRFVFADLEAPPFIDDSFDFVVAAASVQRTRLHVTIPALRRLVAPGGRLALYVNVSAFPRLRDWRAVRACLTIPGAIVYLRTYGLRTAWRLVRFQTSRAWLDQGQHVESLRASQRPGDNRSRIVAAPVPTPQALVSVSARLLPGCRVERISRSAMTVVWDAAE